MKWIEEGCEVVFGEIEEIAVSCECQKRTEENHWTDLRFSNFNYWFVGEVPDAERFWDFLAFLEIKMVRVGQESMKRKQDHGRQ